MTAVIVDAISRDDSLAPCDPWVESRVRDPGAIGARRKLVFSIPTQSIDTGDAIATMWEADRLPRAAVPNLNRASCVVVPAAPVADWFRASGVAAPIRVVPLGLDLDVFRDDGTPPPGGKIVFGCAGRTSHGGLRKGLDDVVAAFLAAFPGRDDVELRVKVWEDCRLRDPGDPRVAVDRRALPDEGVADWLRGLTAFVSASRGEGWGYWCHQAMAVGRPCIAPLWGGTTAYADASSVYPADFDVRRVPDGTPHYGGYGASWCVPRVESLVARMREVYDDEAGRTAKGRAGAIAAARFPWAIAGRRMADVLREFGLMGGKAAAKASPAPSPLPAPRLVPLAESIAVAKAIRACGFRTPPSCGCPGVPASCSREDRPYGGRPLYHDCQACRSAAGVAPAVGPVAELAAP